MKKTTWARAAAYIDGEGCIGVAKCNARHKDDKRAYVQYSLNLNITNTNLKLLQFFKDNFGGNISLDNRAIIKAKQDVWKKAFKWFLAGRRAQEFFLLGVLPYLILKREQAIVALAFLRLERTKSSTQLREASYQKSLLLNAKGPSSPETNTRNDSFESKIESELIGDYESAPVVTQVA